MTDKASTPTIDLAPYQQGTDIQRILHSAKTVAVVGLSPNELRASNFVGFYLKRARVLEASWGSSSYLRGRFAKLSSY